MRGYEGRGNRTRHGVPLAGAIRENADRPNVAFFVDPPYTIAGRGLYTQNQLRTVNFSRFREVRPGTF